MAEPLGRNFQTKPVSQLNRFLRRIGLRLAKVQTEKVAGKKIRRYGIPAGQRDRMTALAQSLPGGRSTPGTGKGGVAETQEAARSRP